MIALLIVLVVPQVQLEVVFVLLSSRGGAHGASHCSWPVATPNASTSYDLELRS